MLIASVAEYSSRESQCRHIIVFGNWQLALSFLTIYLQRLAKNERTMSRCAPDAIEDAAEMWWAPFSFVHILCFNRIESITIQVYCIYPAIQMGDSNNSKAHQMGNVGHWSDYQFSPSSLMVKINDRSTCLSASSITLSKFEQTFGLLFHRFSKFGGKTSKYQNLGRYPPFEVFFRLKMAFASN